jgi:hypothetical protein
MLPDRVSIWRRYRLFVLITFLTWVPYQSQAKTVGLSAIVIYPGTDGQDMAQITGFVMNGKNEVYQCAGTGNIEKSAYHKLVKVSLAAGMSLERNAQGVLMLISDGQDPVCVVPANLKLEKEDSLSAAALADRATVEGNVLPGSDPPITQVPATLKPGIKLVFVVAPDMELANYLRAERQGDIPGWRRYLAQDASGAHLPNARKSLSALYQKAASADFQAYTSSKGGTAPDYAKLAEARQMADLAHAQVRDDAATADLSKTIHAEILDLSQQSKSKLELYHDAFRQQAPGYANLVAAEKLANGAYNVEPETPEATSAEIQSKLDRANFEKVLRDTDTQIGSQHPDEAARTIAPLQVFGLENSRVADDLRSISILYVARAKKSEETDNWGGAVSDLQKAQGLSPSPDTQALLASAQQRASIAANQAAARAALQKSQDAETGGDIVRAYEVLDDLPADQHALVTERLGSLKDQYVQVAEGAATNEQKAHQPVNGITDEEGIQRAYGYLQRCYRLTGDPTLQDRIALLGEDLTAYYLQQGKKYADKPDGTGVNVAWTYLSEALQYSSQSNAGDVRDERERVRSTYNLRSRLSIQVEFRDSTSRRDSVDFATQLTDAMANGLESLGHEVSVLRTSDNTPVPPNFRLVGDVIQHELGKQPEIVPKDSTYRSSERPVRNPDYDKATREYEQAKEDLQMARTELQDAETRNKKKDIEAARKTVADNEQKLKDANERLGTLQEFNMVPVIDKYV